MTRAAGPPSTEVRSARTKTSPNGPRSRQTEPDVLRRDSGSEVRQPDSARRRQTESCCMACRRSGVRIPLTPPDLFPQLRGLDRRLRPHRRASGPVDRFACSCRSGRFSAFCRDLLRSRSRSPADPPLTREFSPQIPNGSQTESPSGQDGLGDSDDRARAIETGIPNGPPADAQSRRAGPGAGYPAPPPPAPRAARPGHLRPMNGSGVLAGGIDRPTDGWWAWYMPGAVPFAGREGELSRLVGALGGSAQLMLVTGDAGVGKTRLTGEACRLSSPIAEGSGDEPSSLAAELGGPAGRA
jgi:hypothetical protein